MCLHDKPRIENVNQRKLDSLWKVHVTDRQCNSTERHRTKYFEHQGLFIKTPYRTKAMTGEASQKIKC